MVTRLRRTTALVALWRQLRRSRRDGGPGAGTLLRALPRMVLASLRRRDRYDGLGRLLLMALAVAYLVWPVDLLPELPLGPVGLLDDTVVVTWLAGAVLSETSRFLQWERGRAALSPPAPRLPVPPRP